MARRKNEFAASTQTSLVDTFTCAIGMLFICLLVAGTAAHDPKSIPGEETVFTCLIDGRYGPDASFFRVGDDTGRRMSSEDFADVLAHARREDRLSLRVTVNVSPGRTDCSRAASDVVRDLNSRLSTPRTDDDRKRPFLVLDLVRTVAGSGSPL
jgi:hypothetical protein